MPQDDKPTEAEELAAIENQLASNTSDVYPIVQDISLHTRRARKALEGDIVDTLSLSNEIVELAILNQRLGERVSMQGHLTRWAKEFYERSRENHKVRLVRDEKIAAGVADSMKVELAHASFDIYNDCEYQMDRLVHLRRGTDKTIDTIRTKISFEKQDRANG